MELETAADYVIILMLKAVIWEVGALKKKTIPVNFYCELTLCLTLGFSCTLFPQLQIFISSQEFFAYICPLIAN